ncbi:patatin-like phospholipase family protein [Caloramator sp. mosi_1]|uniref:patatin-like phospholipase family protein n=1 Tax=Caloramator sp. mosi_1 TaxID=3023090 RepID=UPI00235DF2C2|nr:patatin-like phospholipase family protein [Caloramator sp. mosi_1]WDC83538.1 patatin-like phospholipase family protein [Caloramator sp. mosi_1]
MYIDAVFEGGGVKGIAFLGAIKCLEERGYKFNKVAGTSAGAIISSLIAAGYSADELKQILFNFDFINFQDKDAVQSLPFIGSILGLVVSKAIFSGDAFENWLKELLVKKGKVKFKNFINNNEFALKIIASDITKKDILILPDDLKEYGIDPLEFEVAKAVRMSMSIPLYFKPVKLKVNDEIHYIVDGGILSNFPVWIFDVEGIPRWPTFGFKLQEPAPKPRNEYISLKDYLMDIVNTMIEENELRYIKNKDFVRTILIPTLGVNTTDFSISNSMKQKLYISGYNSAKTFLETWNFDDYVKDIG